MTYCTLFCLVCNYPNCIFSSWILYLVPLQDSDAPVEEIEESDYSEEYEDWVTDFGYHLVSRCPKYQDYQVKAKSFCDQPEQVGFMMIYVSDCL